jgi:hypothetical protein
MDLPWTWILWIAAVIVALGALVSLAMKLRSDLQAKLDNYIREQTMALVRKRKALAELRRRHELAQKIISERQAQESAAALAGEQNP